MFIAMSVNHIVLRKMLTNVYNIENKLQCLKRTKITIKSKNWF